MCRAALTHSLTHSLHWHNTRQTVMKRLLVGRWITCFCGIVLRLRHVPTVQWDSATVHHSASRCYDDRSWPMLLSGCRQARSESPAAPPRTRNRGYWTPSRTRWKRRRRRRASDSCRTDQRVCRCHPASTHLLLQTTHQTTSWLHTIDVCTVIRTAGIPR